MTIHLSGRAAAARAASVRHPRGGGLPKVAPRVDLDALAERVFAAQNKDEKCLLFVAYLRALGLTGEVALSEIEVRYWVIMGAACPTESDWRAVWLSMSRKLGRELVKRQRRDQGGARRRYLVIPAVGMVQ